MPIYRSNQLSRQPSTACVWPSSEASPHPTLPSSSVILTKSHRGGTRKYSIVAILPILLVSIRYVLGQLPVGQRTLLSRWKDVEFVTAAVRMAFGVIYPGFKCRRGGGAILSSAISPDPLAGQGIRKNTLLFLAIFEYSLWSFPVTPMAFLVFVCLSGVFGLNVRQRPSRWEPTPTAEVWVTPLHLAASTTEMWDHRSMRHRYCFRVGFIYRHNS